MKMKHLLIAVLTFLTGFSSCTQDENTEQTQESKSVFMKLEKPNSDTTRGVYSSVGSNVAINFSGGYLYFVTNNGQITNFFTITTAPTSATNINLGTLQSSTGELIKNIKNNAV